MIRFTLNPDNSKQDTPQRAKRESVEKGRARRMAVGDGLLLRDDFRIGQSCTAKRLRYSCVTDEEGRRMIFQAKPDKAGRGTVVWRIA